MCISVLQIANVPEQVGGSLLGYHSRIPILTTLSLGGFPWYHKPPEAMVKKGTMWWIVDFKGKSILQKKRKGKKAPLGVWVGITQFLPKLSFSQPLTLTRPPPKGGKWDLYPLHSGYIVIAYFGTPLRAVVGGGGGVETALEWPLPFCPDHISHVVLLWMNGARISPQAPPPRGAYLEDAASARRRRGICQKRLHVCTYMCKCIQLCLYTVLHLKRMYIPSMCCMQTYVRMRVSIYIYIVYTCMMAVNKLRRHKT